MPLTSSSNPLASDFLISNLLLLTGGHWRIERGLSTNNRQIDENILRGTIKRWIGPTALSSK